ncbi:hypothetical protein SO802_015858 [Lithocarpus litseifolius]|uniref:Uncharacterized protein n=1 Tax=Lithocarpus litseifolius TaxID=425828 RepID=A0AAW2CUV8_9ROSI
MGRHCFYIYYDGKQYFHDLPGLPYRGESVKQKFTELKCRTHLRKMHRKIMETLGLDRESHKISIVYCAPQLLVNTQVVYNSNPLGCNANMDMMWTVIKRTPQFIVSDLYVTVEAIRFRAGASSQHSNGVEEPHSSSLDVHPSFADATPLPYNTQPCSAVDDLDNTEVLGATHTHDVGGSSHTFFDISSFCLLFPTAAIAEDGFDIADEPPRRFPLEQWLKLYLDFRQLFLLEVLLFNHHMRQQTQLFSQVMFAILHVLLNSTVLKPGPDRAVRPGKPGTEANSGFLSLKNRPFE